MPEAGVSSSKAQPFFEGLKTSQSSTWRGGRCEDYPYDPNVTSFTYFYPLITVTQPDVFFSEIEAGHHDAVGFWGRMKRMKSSNNHNPP